MNKHIKLTALFVLFLLNISFAQNGKGNRENNLTAPVFVENHILPSDSNFICILSYKIPFSSVVFVRENSHYSSGYTISFELFEKDKFIKRVYSSNKIIASNYSETNAEDKFSSGFVSLNISEGNYLIKPSIIIENTDIEAKIKPIEIRVDSNQIYKPFYVSSVSQNDDSTNYRLINSQNAIPFSDEKYDMLIPTFHSDEKSFEIEVIQNKETVLKSKIDDFVYLNPNFEIIENEIYLSSNLSIPKIKFYKFSFINQKLVDDKFEIILKRDTTKIKFEQKVVWFDKPKSLANIEEAIEHLKIIGLNKQVDSLLNFSEELQYHALHKFWSKYDDDKSTAFNAVFGEFYSRIDFVKSEFNSVGKKDALETDRGKTYINFGKPDSITRTFNDVYDVIEVWEYKSLNEKIYFSDKTGAGKFERIK